MNLSISNLNSPRFYVSRIWSEIKTIYLKGIAFAIFVILSLLFCQPTSSHPLETIPLDSWVYPVLEQLYTQKLFPKLHSSLKPYTRGEIAAYLMELEKLQQENRLTLTKSQTWLIDKLKDEFSYEISTLMENSPAASVKYNLNPALFYYSAQDKKPVRGKFKLGGSYQYSNQFLFKLKGVIDTQAEKDPQFFGRKWKKNLTGHLDQAYLHWETKYVKILFGRDNQNWSPTLGDGLLFSGKSPALDQIRLSMQLGYFRFSYFSSVLDKIFDPDSGSFANRYLSAHSLNFKHPKGIELGLSETVIYGGINRSVELYYLNPILPYYLEQFNQNTPDNILWSLTFDLSFWKDKEFYGELLIDDFQYDFKSEPHQIGYLLGTRLANLLNRDGSYLNLEYRRIGFWVYGADISWNRFLYHDRNLGSVLGPDTDLIRGSFLYNLRKDFSLQFSAGYRRKGEGKIDMVYPSPLPAVSKFPSGVVEKTSVFEILGVFQPDAKFKIDLGLQLQSRKNISNIADKNIRGEFSLNLRIEYNFWKEKGI
ncbi:MAG: hypothetical protein RBG1_1C00001G1726 [candidate division Zixibacteria bacterium RBG-1]|nr:MAG: hypothetical protein RBG1_1C00001G1726 [candidate division Zixibacteria bacterium RBG-1]